jgi:cellulose synthase operon protein C
MRKEEEIGKVLATAVLSLAQIYVDTNEADKAVTLLEDPKIGVLTLVKNNDPAASDEGVPAETYKTALRAYISSLAGKANAAATIEKARGIMDALKQHLAESPQGQQMLVSIYVGLARDLQRQMEIADPAAKKPLGVGFETFLKEVAADATELNVLNWVGDTYLGMGEAFGTGLRSLTPEARSYFTKAAETYQKILDKGKSDSEFLPPQMAAGIRIKLARANKSMGQYIAAADILQAILIASPMILPAQIEAAKLYQDWGAAGKQHRENYMKAIVGTRPDKSKNDKNTFWGWGEIARMTANNQQFKDFFYDARYNLALCRYNYALAQDDAAAKKEQLQKAKSDIALTAGLYPELGGEEKKRQFDNLLKNIQKALGDRTDGLKALQSPPPSIAPGKGKTTAVSAATPPKK